MKRRTRARIQRRWHLQSLSTLEHGSTADARRSQDEQQPRLNWPLVLHSPGEMLLEADYPNLSSSNADLPGGDHPSSSDAPLVIMGMTINPSSSPAFSPSRVAVERSKHWGFLNSSHETHHPIEGRRG
jgi:hypothetical protein